MRAARRRLRPAWMLAVAFSAAVPASALAEGKLEARYSVTLAGIPIGKGSWMIELTDTHYRAAASGVTTGLVRLFIGGQGTSAAKGTISEGKPQSSIFASTIITSNKADEVRIAVNDGSVKDFHIDPPQDKDPQRVPITKEHQHGILDPMTAMLLRTPGTGEAVSEAACHRTVAIFDGRLRYDLKLDFKRMDHVRAEKGYDGPAVVCTVHFVPIAGYVPSRAAIKYIRKQRDIEVWLAPIMGTRVLVPFRIQGPTPVGKAIMQATQFVSVATPTRASARGVKVQ